MPRPSLSLPPSVLRFQPLLVIVLPVAVLVVAFFYVIQPRIATTRLARTRLAALEQRLVLVQAALVDESIVTGADTASMMIEFESLTPLEARVHELLQHIAQRLGDGSGERVRNLVIETGAPSDAPGEDDEARPAAGSVVTDPRLALFRTALSHTPVTVTFESSYARLGQFLWELRDLPVLVEVRALEVGPAPREREVRARLVLFAFQRLASLPEPTREPGEEGSPRS